MILRGCASLRLFSTLFLTLLLWSGGAYAAGFPPAMIRDASRAVKMLVTEGNGDRMGQGTGFFVTPDGLMLTNYHVVEGNRTIKIWDEKNLYDIVRIVAFDKNADVALLETNYPKSSVRHLPLRK
ncbi:MAG TPA: serine protease, partial [Synergistales bacterium]|nr:serine protease [Synergistales bacterium]